MEMIWFALIASALAAGAAAFVARAYVRGGPEKPRKALVLAGLAGAGLAALALYAALGRPALPDAPMEQRLAALKTRDPASLTIEETLAVLAARGRAAPKDARPHLYSGDLYLQLDRPEDAAKAYRAALRRDPQAGAAVLGLARAEVALAQGAITPQALALFEEAARLRPDDPAPLLYQALAAMRDRRGAEALRLWGQVKARLKPDDPRHAMVSAMLEEAGRL